ncbi:MAG: hypothetical protein K8R02_03050 [Anaerohalosphaeraceae bacterium]|nr:hypothetical protein [Anaerohalosphaeraceae bacterium]
MTSKKILRIIIATIAISVFGAIVGMITCGWLFRWVYEIEPINVWKPMDGPPGAMFYLGCFIMNLIFVSVYALLRKGIPGKSLIAKGLVYGLCVFAVGQLNGMLMTYMFMTVAWQVIVYWTIQGLIWTPISGVIAATIYGKD